MPLSPEQLSEIEAARSTPRQTLRAVSRGWRRIFTGPIRCSTTALSG